MAYFDCGSDVVIYKEAILEQEPKFLKEATADTLVVS